MSETLIPEMSEGKPSVKTSLLEKVRRLFSGEKKESSQSSTLPAEGGARAVGLSISHHGHGFGHGNDTGDHHGHDFGEHGHDHGDYGDNGHGDHGDGGHDVDMGGVDYGGDGEGDGGD